MPGPPTFGPGAPQVGEDSPGRSRVPASNVVVPVRSEDVADPDRQVSVANAATVVFGPQPHVNQVASGP